MLLKTLALALSITTTTACYTSARTPTTTASSSSSADDDDRASDAHVVLGVAAVVGVIAVGALAAMAGGDGPASTDDEPIEWGCIYGGCSDH